MRDGMKIKQKLLFLLFLIELVTLFRVLATTY